MKKFSIQKKEHLKLQKTISSIIKTGNKYSDKYLKIFVNQNNKSYSKFTLVINKTFGKSVLRNKAKRHIRELFRINKNRLKTGYNIVFFIKTEFKNISFPNKKANYLQLLKEAGLLKECNGSVTPF